MQKQETWWTDSTKTLMSVASPRHEVQVDDLSTIYLPARWSDGWYWVCINSTCRLAQCRIRVEQ